MPTIESDLKKTRTSPSESDLNEARTLIAGIPIRYWAEFFPQRWSRRGDDQVCVPVPPLGTYRWDCTEFVNKLPIEQRMRALLGDSYECDNIRNDSQAPEWIRTWDGPFEVKIHGRG